jgi:hypothetical protein
MFFKTAEGRRFDVSAFGWWFPDAELTSVR